MTRKILFAFFASLFTLCAHAELTTVPNLDLTKYLGDWEEVARFENEHQQGCKDSHARYTQKKGYIEITNTCTTSDGKTKSNTGRAKLGDEKDNARLRVNFTPTLIRIFNIGWGNYWVILLGDNYEFSVVSEPTMKKLWILSRTKPMTKAVYDDIVARLQKMGFDTAKLVVNDGAVASTITN